MTDPSLCAAAALTAVLADRSFLKWRLGSRSEIEPFERLGPLVPVLAAASVMVILGALSAGLLSVYSMGPLHARFLAAAAFAATVLACALAGEILWTDGRPAQRNRAFSRAAVIALVLGLSSLPFYREDTPGSIATFVISGIEISLAYALMAIFYNGISQKISSERKPRGQVPVAQELCSAGLLALVIIGILKTFQ
jgi:Na+-translocating ferredoxin:NAD+ oxidoreductase RnfA subunit